MGPTLKNLNNLLSLPFGCGEQNLANFAPNVYVLKYLKGTRQMNEETRLKAIRYLQMGECDVTIERFNLSSGHSTQVISGNSLISTLTGLTALLETGTSTEACGELSCFFLIFKT